MYCTVLFGKNVHSKCNKIKSWSITYVIAEERTILYVSISIFASLRRDIHSRLHRNQLMFTTGGWQSLDAII